MAFVRVAFFPGAQAHHLQALAEAMASAPESPPGRLVFVSGAVEGGWQVVQVWEDRAALESFNAAWFLPALERLGSAGFPRPPEVRDSLDAEVWISRPGHDQHG